MPIVLTLEGPRYATEVVPNGVIERELFSSMPNTSSHDRRLETNRAIALMKTFIAHQFS
jgi:hypothetical protein